MNLLTKTAIVGSFVAGSAWLGIHEANAANNTVYPLRPVSKVDMQAFSGKWYEIAFVPYIFEKAGQRDAVTQYTIKEPYVFEDHFEAILPNGKTRTYTGRLKSKSAGTSKEPDGRFRSTFFKLFNWQYWLGVDYLLVGLGKNYDYAVVTLPNRKLNWVFSRTPKLNDQQLGEIGEVLNAQHIDPCKMQVIPQAGGLQKQQPFCQVLNGKAQ